MKIAILSDIHGNYPALLNVIKEIEKNKVQKLLLLGDYVGYYYQAKEVLVLLENYEKEMIKGNHEILLEYAIKNQEKLSSIQEKYGLGIRYAIKSLSNNEIEFLISLPYQKVLEIDNLKILISHGAPWNIWEYIYPDSPEYIKKRCLGKEFNFVFIGHSHYSFIYEYKNNFLINVGSVGQNRKKGGIATWALLDTKAKEVVLKETAYNVSITIQNIREDDPNYKYLVGVLQRNRHENY